MMCPFPITIRNPKSKAYLEKIYGKGTQDFYDKSTLQVPCGKCGACLENHKNEWIFRAEEELSVSASAHFITLTYSPDRIPYTEAGVETLEPSDVTKFIKRLKRRRDRLETKYKKNKKPIPWQDKKVRYLTVGEYGGKYNRPHYHILLFNVPLELIRTLADTWAKGRVHVGRVENKSIAYVAGYMGYKNPEEDSKFGRYPTYATASRPALGISFVEKKKLFYDLLNKHIFTAKDIQSKFQESIKNQYGTLKSMKTMLSFAKLLKNLHLITQKPEKNN